MNHILQPSTINPLSKLLLVHEWVLSRKQSLLLTPLSEELSSISVDEVHNLYDHCIDNAWDEQQYSCPECGVLIVN